MGPFELPIAALPGRSDKVVDPGDSLVARPDAILMKTVVKMFTNLLESPGYVDMVEIAIFKIDAAPDSGRFPAFVVL
jgi:hypothetical protein